MSRSTSKSEEFLYDHETAEVRDKANFFAAWDNDMTDLTKLNHHSLIFHSTL